MTGGYTCIPSRELDALLDRTLVELAADIEKIKTGELRAVVLGGGYGRGEGGVHHTAQGDRPYNDLDFFVFTSGADRAATARLDRILRDLSLRWEQKLGIAVDFGPAKNLNALPGVAHTLMYQELLRGWRPVWGEWEPERWLPARAPEELPFTEAARLLLNRGMGLLLAGEYLRDGTDDPDFIIRNMNKTILGSGDALLIADGTYCWSGRERVKTFAAYAAREKLPADFASRYAAAFHYKIEPDPVMPDDPAAAWQQCREFYLASVRRIAEVPEDASAPEMSAGLSHRAAAERSVKNMLRWARRTKQLRLPNGTFDAPVITVLGKLLEVLQETENYPICPPNLRRLWTMFG